MKIFGKTLFAFAVVALIAIACVPVGRPITMKFDQKYVDNNVVIYLNSKDAGVNLLLPSFTQYGKWFTNVSGQAIEHNSIMAFPSSKIVLMLTDPISLPFGGVATPEPSSTPIPAGTIVFSDRYQSNGQDVYIDGFYNHCTYSFGYGLPKQGGKFNQWYTVENGMAIKHEGEISLLADSYQYSQTGWSFQKK